MPATKSVFSLRPSRKKKRERGPSEEAVDQTLDDALKSLADATKANIVACEKVRKRQSSGSLKLVSIPPGDP
jgi:hypothetical protein